MTATVKVTKEALAALIDEGITDVEALAQHLGVWPRTIERAMVRYEIRDPKPNRHLTQEEISTMRRLREAGVPTKWIADTVGTDPHRVIQYAGPSQDPNEFARVWGYIRRNPTLAALHREFMPRRRQA